MKMYNCFACGIEKDLSQEAVYPYPEDDCLCDEPIPQLLTIECQSEKGWDFRMVVMCHDCWHRLVITVGIDMWIGQSCWESLNPKMPFDKLPEVIKDPETTYTKWDAENYPMEIKTMTHVGLAIMK